jgi:hypothetical integral membrane protein (TIGR02206 family)
VPALLSSAHLTILAAIAAAGAALGGWIRLAPAAARFVRFTLGALLALNELTWFALRYSREGIHASFNLPLQLSDLVFWVAIFVLFTCRQPAFDFLYYAGLPTAVMAVITPDLWSPVTSFAGISFFVAHGGIIVTVLMLLWGRVMRPGPPGVRHVWAPLLGWAALAGAADWAFEANYMYLREKPRAFSILNWLGPWPVYIAASGGLAWVLFQLLWRPFRGARGAGVDECALKL